MIPPNIDRLRIAGPAKKRKSKSGNDVVDYPVTTDFASARNRLIGILGKPTEDRKSSGRSQVVKWKKPGLSVVLQPVGSSDEYVVSIIMKSQLKAYARIELSNLEATEQEKARVVKAWQLGNEKQRTYNINPYMGNHKPPEGKMLWLVTHLSTGARYLVSAVSATKPATAQFFKKISSGTL